MFEQLTFDLEIWKLIFGMSSVVFGGFLRGFLGFGSALLIVPVLSIILSPLEAIVIFMLIEIPNTAYLMPSACREFDAKSVFLMIVGIIITVPFGALALISIDPNIMRMVISIMVLIMVGLLASGWKIKAGIGPISMFMTGLVGGLAHGATGVGGPPLITVLLSKGDHDTRTRANIVISLNTLTIMGAITLLVFGAMSSQLFLASCILGPLYVASTAIGARYFYSSRNILFRRAALLVLALLATLIIASTLQFSEGVS